MDAEVEAFLERAGSEWSVLPDGKLRCELTGHEMKAAMAQINEHINGRRYNKAKRPPKVNTEPVKTEKPAAADKKAKKKKSKEAKPEEDREQPQTEKAKKRKEPEKDESEDDAVDDDPIVWADTRTVFVGQLSYSTTKEAIETYFRNAITAIDSSLRDTPIEVRLQTDKKTNKSKGTAFVTFATHAILLHALTLHHTPLEGRRINVERTVPGGGKGQKRKRNLKSLIKVQDKQLEEQVQEVVTEFVKAGKISKSDIDQRTTECLRGFNPPTMRDALRQFSESALPTDGRERRRYLMGILKRLRPGTDSEAPPTKKPRK